VDLARVIDQDSTDVLAPIMAWWITFTVVLLLLFAFGFNPIGIGAGIAHSQCGHAQLPSDVFLTIPQ
jgi:hypothetical protein